MTISKKTFLYFAYGSNLLKERIHINNPSAVKKAVGRLSGYRLDFNYQSARWNGAVGTITKDTEAEVWGVIWEIGMEHLETLDKQESVHSGIYRPIQVAVTTPEAETLVCRCYELILPLEADRRPSRVYKEVIIQGAIQNALPEYYVRSLEKITDNGYAGPVAVKLNLEDRKRRASESA